jgi:hypothetical protein
MYLLSPVSCLIGIGAIGLQRDFQLHRRDQLEARRMILSAASDKRRVDRIKDALAKGLQVAD